MAVIEEISMAIKYYKWFKRPDIFFKDITYLIPGKDQEKLLIDVADLSIRKMIISAGRSLGKTRTLSVIALWTSIILPRFMTNIQGRVIIGAGSKVQASEMYKYITDYISEHDWLYEQVYGEVTMNKTQFKYKNKGHGRPVIEIVTASKKSYRGKHGDLIIVDEAVEAPDDFVETADAQVSTSPLGRVIYSSTPHNYASLFVTYWEDADIIGLKRYGYWSAYNCHWINEDSIKSAKAKLPEARFAMEWLGEPRANEELVFPTKALRKYCLIDDIPKRVQNAPTFMGIDWGWHHETVITIVQRLPLDVKGEDNAVYFNVLAIKPFTHTRPSVLYKEIISLYYDYGVSKIFADSSHIMENKELMSKGLRLISVPFKTHKERMISYLQFLVHNGRIKIWREFAGLTSQMRNFTWSTDKNDDRVSSLMLACSDTAINRNISDSSFQIVHVEVSSKQNKKSDDGFWLKLFNTSL